MPRIAGTKIALLTAAVISMGLAAAATADRSLRARPTVAAAATSGVTAAPMEIAASALQSLPVKGRAAKTGYARSRFGQAWADIDRNGCDTRNDVLRRDLVHQVIAANGCAVLSGTLVDVYSGITVASVRGGSDVQVDHVVALADAWVKGAQGLPPARRAAFANDPLNLIATTATMNAQKGAGDAATWLPPRRSVRCAYVARQIAVKRAYRLWVTKAEREAMARVLETCPGQVMPAGPAVATPRMVVRPSSTTARASAAAHDP